MTVKSKTVHWVRCDGCNNDFGPDQHDGVDYDTVVVKVKPPRSISTTAEILTIANQQNEEGSAVFLHFHKACDAGPDDPTIVAVLEAWRRHHA